MTYEFPQPVDHRMWLHIIIINLQRRVSFNRNNHRANYNYKAPYAAFVGNAECEVLTCTSPMVYSKVETFTSPSVNLVASD